MTECLRFKKHYIAKTKRILRERYKEHRQATNNPNPSYATAAVPTHINFLVHCVADIRLIPLELQPNNNGSQRKAREAYIIERKRVKLCRHKALNDGQNER